MSSLLQQSIRVGPYLRVLNVMLQKPLRELIASYIRMIPNLSKVMALIVMLCLIFGWIGALIYDDLEDIRCVSVGSSAKCHE